MMTTQDAISAVAAFFSSHTNAIPAISSGASGNTLGALTGLGQVAVSLIQAFGRKVAMPIDFIVTAASTAATLKKISDDYEKKGVVDKADLWSVASGAAGLLGIVGVAAVSSVPMVLATVAAATVATTVLTALALTSTGTVDIDGPLKFIKESVQRAAEISGSALFSYLDLFTSKTFPAIAEQLDISSTDGGKVSFSVLSDGTRFVTDAERITDFGVDVDGKVYLQASLGSVSAVTDPRIVFDGVTGSYIAANGVKVVGIPPGAVLVQGPGSLTATSVINGFTQEITFDGQSVSVQWRSSDGSIVVKSASNLTEVNGTLQWTQNGQTFTGGDLDGFVRSIAAGVQTTKSAGIVQASMNQLAARFNVQALGVSDALNNAITNQYMGDRITFGNVPERWFPAFLNSDMVNQLSLANTQSAAIQQALISQAAWQAKLPYTGSIITVLVYENGRWIGPFGSVVGGAPAPFLGNSSPRFPLVLDLTGKGVSLIPAWQSDAVFDLDADGEKKVTSWVDAEAGILVLDRNGNGIIDNASEWFGESFSAYGQTPLAGQDGFKALATLAASGTSMFSRATARTDSVTGKNFFDLVQVWQDANGNGVTDAGELRTLAQLGIESIDLNATSDGRKFSAGEIGAVAGYTAVGGGRGQAVDVGLLPAGVSITTPTWMPSAAAVIFAEYTAKGYAVISQAQANGIQQALSARRANFSAEISKLQSWMSTIRYRTSGGIQQPVAPIGDASLISVYDSVRGSSGSRAGLDMVALLQDGISFDAQVVNVASAISGGSGSIFSAETAAQVANATGKTSNFASALSSARAAANQWGSAMTSFLDTYAVSLSLNNRMLALQTELNQFIPVNRDPANHLPGGKTYFSAGDADFAADTFTSYANMLQFLSDRKAAMDQLLGAIAQSSGYASAYVASSGQITTAGSGFNLLLAQGSPTVVLGSRVDHVLLSAAASQVSVRNFSSGAAGDQLKFLGIGDTVSVLSIAGGIRIQAQNGAYADLAGVTASTLDLFSNVVGVSAISFAGMLQSGTYELRGDSFFDGQVHLNKIIASNLGDTLIGGAWQSVLQGGEGNDTFVVRGGEYAIDGGLGKDVVSYAELGGSVMVNLAAGQDNLGSTLVRVENVVGTRYRDWLTGDGSNNVLEGGGGADTLTGAGGNDRYVYGRGDGADTVINGVLSNASASSVLVFKDNLGANDLWLTRSGNDLLIQILGGHDQIRVQGWYADESYKLGAIQLANGLRLDTAGVEDLVTMLAGYAGFDPRRTSALPGGLSLETYFQQRNVPEVPETINVVLETKDAYTSGNASAKAAVANAIAAAINQSAGLASSAGSAASSQASVVTPREWTASYRIYRYTTSKFPGTFYTVTQSNFSNTQTQAIFGITWYEELSGFEAGRIYYDVTNRPTNGTLSRDVMEGEAGVMDAILNALSTANSALSPIGAIASRFGTALAARQQALAAAVTANETSSPSSGAVASSLSFEDKFFAAINSYQGIYPALARAQAALAGTSALLARLAVPANTTSSNGGTTSYSFHSSVDQAKYNALAAAIQSANNAYATAQAQVAGLFGTLSGIGKFSQVRYVEPSGTAVAGAGGELLIGGGSGRHILIGGAGRDLFALTNNLLIGPARDTIKLFQVGTMGDRLLLETSGSILRGGAGVGFFSQEADGTVVVEYYANGSRGVVRLDGVTYDKGLSLYDNFLGMELADFSAGKSGVKISLDSATSRAKDGFTHISSLKGTAYADTLIGDSQDNTLYGGGGDDVLTGGAGNDTLYGESGNDTMIGGAGDDTYYVGSSGDIIIELADEGVDTVSSSLSSTTLWDNVENLVITSSSAANGYGNASDNVIYSGAGNNIMDGGLGNDTASYTASIVGVTVSLATTNPQVTGHGTDTLLNFENLTGSNYADRLTGNAQDNVLDGGVGADWMSGGAGNDIYYVDNAGDVVVEAVDEGIDTVYSSLGAHILGANVENGRILSTGVANMTGNGLSNVIYAGSGNNVMDGGAGIDTVSYLYATGAVTASLATTAAQATGGSGSDTLRNVENLTGSDYSDTLAGNADANVIDGGKGADQMSGGAGDDRYIVDDAGDKVIEAANAGIDQVDSYLAAYTLGANVEDGRIMSTGSANMTGNALANLIYAGDGNNVITGGAGAGNDTVSYLYAKSAVTVSLATTAAQNTGGSGTDTLSGIQWLTGSNYNDTLTGSDGDNHIDGGAGVDRMIGGAGNDLYYIDNPGDIIVELAGEGTDTVYSKATSYTLPDYVENLRIWTSSSANATGNGMNNTIFAGNGNNVIDGGAGNDTVSYQFASAAVTVSLATTTAQATGSSGVDTLRNFENLTGSDFDDTLTGDANNNILLGGAGADTIYGGAGADRLDGGAGNDTLIGGTGSDALYGSLGNDTYVFGRGDGADTIYENDATAGNQDVVSFGADIQNKQLWFSRSGNNLVVDLIGTSDRITISNWYLGAQYRVETLQTASGAILAAEKVEALVQAMAGVTKPSSGQLVLNAAQEAALSGVLVSSWQGGSGPASRTQEGTEGDDTLSGDDGDDTLIGHGGNDTLNGGAGRNTLIGGAGNDVYIVSNANDVIVELANKGIDRVQASVSFVLPDNVENLLLSGTASINGTGNALNNTVTGNAGNNILSGGAGDDLLVGLGGDDVLIGGTGSDRYLMTSQSTSRIIETESLAGDVDVVQVSVAPEKLWFRRVGNDLEVSVIGMPGRSLVTDWYLGSQYQVERFVHGVASMLTSDRVEQLVVAMSAFAPPPVGQYSLTAAQEAALGSVRQSSWQTYVEVGAPIGGSDDDRLEGTEGADTLLGGDGDDTLIGYGGNDMLDGGSGRNMLIGGKGDDVYIVSNETDTIIELASEGADRVQASVSFVLPDNVENLTLTGTANLNGTGNALNNSLVGNSGNNILAGGAGNDTLLGAGGDDVLIGGTGSDRYVMSAHTDQTDRIVETESLAGDVDTLQVAGARDKLWFRQVGNDLEVSIIGMSNTMLITDWYLGSQHRVEKILAGGATLTDDRVENLVAAMAAFAPPAAGQTTLPAAYQTALAPVIAANWQ